MARPLFYCMDQTLGANHPGKKRDLGKASLELRQTLKRLTAGGCLSRVVPTDGTTHPLLKNDLVRGLSQCPLQIGRKNTVTGNHIAET